MTYKYRYLGRRGIFIEGKQYHCEDIVETKKSLEELGLDPHLFADLKGKSERDKLKAKIEALEDERKLLEQQAEKELKSLEKAYKGRLASMDKKIQDLKRIYSEQFEPKRKETVKSKEKIKIKGGS